MSAGILTFHIAKPIFLTLSLHFLSDMYKMKCIILLAKSVVFIFHLDPNPAVSVLSLTETILFPLSEHS